MWVLAMMLGKYSAAFESLTSTLWLFATVGVYTFGAPVISDLFISFPCYDGAVERMMVLSNLVHKNEPLTAFESTGARPFHAM